MTSTPSIWKKIGDALNTGDDKGVVIAVALSLVIVVGIVAGYYIYHVFNEKPEGYTSIYVLDAQGKAENYTFAVSINQSITFNVYVVNHNGTVGSFQVEEKITAGPIVQTPIDVTPLNVYAKTLADGEIWPIQAPAMFDNAGSYNVIFELWANNSGNPEFTGNFVKLTVDVASQP